jgi:ribosomal protein S18 acetylase RimI-like enzyme
MWFCKHPEYYVLIAHDGEEPCGAMVIHPRGLASSPYLKSIVVSEPYRDKGAGRTLLKSGEDHFRETSRNFFLCVSSFNARARSLYERLGYRRCETRSLTNEVRKSPEAGEATKLRKAE